ncbi:MAG: hypothetical protein DRP42_05125, partial [Tenericutes bacterium]
KFGFTEYCESAGDGLGVQLASLGVKTLATTNMLGTKFSVANQTVDLTAKTPAVYEEVGIRYLSKFQRRHGDSN